MPYCSRCGVEVDAHVPVCPLCGTPIMRFEDLPPSEPTYPALSHKDPGKVYATPEESKVRAYWFLISLLILPSFILLSVDAFISAGRLSWSLLAVSCLGAAALLITVGFLLFPVFWRMALAFSVVGALFLAAIDFLDGPLSWFPTFGLPLLAWLSLLIIGCVQAIVHARTRGYNVFAIILAGVSVFCLGLDGLISLAAEGRWELSWSIIVGLCLLPISFYFFFIHYGLRRGLDLQRTFHI